MFRSARIKLTVWYLLIIMVISLSFSLAIYRVLTAELDRVEQVQRLRIEFRLPEGERIIPPRLSIDPDLIEETKNHLKFILAVINFTILGASAGAGYFLAGRTLKPIKEMVDEQNRFVTDASHELRTPLTSLKSEIEVNLRDKKLTLSEAKKLLVSNLEEVNNLQILSDGLIKLAQYQKGENNLVMVDVSLTSVVETAIKKVAYLAKGNRITIVNKADDYKIEGSSQLLTELFVIFLDNAIKYSPRHSEITLTSEKKDGYVLIHIADQGAGIDKEDIPHLFDRFYRADKSRTKSDVPGYGLGLSIAKQIVDRHHGLLSVQSILNKGTTFTVQLPIKHQNIPKNEFNF